MSEMAKIVELSRQLEAMGCAVVVFTEEELRGARPDLVQDRLIELGWEVINDLAPRSDDENYEEDWSWEN